MKSPGAPGTFIVRFMALVSTYGFSSSSASSSFGYGDDHEDNQSTTTNTNETNRIMVSPGIVHPYTKQDVGPPVVFNGKLFCYKCGAYQNNDEVDFDSALNDCMFKAVETAELEECPNRLPGNLTTLPVCYVNKMMAAGHITSFTRGCMVYYDCLTLDFCESTVNKTGACQSCCREDYCNRAAGERLPTLHLLKLLALILSIYHLFVR